MMRIFAVALLICAISTVGFAHEFKRIPNPPIGKTVAETLKAAGNFNIPLSLLEKAGKGDGSVRNLTQAGPGGGPRTFLAPNDTAFAKLPKGTVEALMKDQQRLKSFLLGHMLPGERRLATEHLCAVVTTRAAKHEQHTNFGITGRSQEYETISTQHNSRRRRASGRGFARVGTDE
jgi:uncharacterized surface protein with fasciclin (FAS1) repeats